jgi:hypothetical protein
MFKVPPTNTRIRIQMRNIIDKIKEDKEALKKYMENSIKEGYPKNKREKIKELQGYYFLIHGGEYYDNSKH